MENRFDNKDFEQFVKQSADQYRMFPSDKVWNGIHNTLHTRRRWYGIGLALLLLTAGTVTWVMLSPADKKQSVSVQTALPTNSPLASVTVTPPAKNIIAPVKPRDHHNLSYIASPDNVSQNLFLADVVNTPATDNDAANSVAAASLVQTPAEPVIAAAANNRPDLVTRPSSMPVVRDTRPRFRPASANRLEIVTDNNVTPLGTPEENKEAITETKLNMQDKNAPLTIESVVNAYQYNPARKHKTLSWQIYVAPTISYRKLKENKGFLDAARSNGGTTNYLAFADINSVVTHKPDVGLELGFTSAYPLFKNINVTAGLQINVSKYDIRAYRAPSEIATIALNNGAGTNSSVSTATTYRNFNGNNTNWLHNLYVTASLPVGLEVKLKGTNRTYFGVGGTIQPTYVLADRAYLISTDYKNYAEIPWLIRKWNLNSSFEAFAVYSTGNIKWKVGPQIRYQALSSFEKQYPVKEHLFDFGLKMGIMLGK